MAGPHKSGREKGRLLIFISFFTTSFMFLAGLCGIFDDFFMQKLIEKMVFNVTEKVIWSKLMLQIEQEANCSLWSHHEMNLKERCRKIIFIHKTNSILTKHKKSTSRRSHKQHYNKSSWSRVVQQHHLISSLYHYRPLTTDWL